MPARMGINCGYPHESDPAELAATGATLVRTVYRRTNDYTSWLPELQRRGIACWFVGDGSPESLGTDESQWGRNMVRAAGEWGHIVKIWQWGNEPDWHGVASWPLSKEQVNRMLVTARSIFPRSQGYTLLAPGLVSGDPAWPEHIRLDLVDGLDVHPYNKFVSTESELRELEYMLATYRDWWHLPLWIGEFDSRTDNLPIYFKTFPGVAAAVTFCWTSGQTAGEGIHGMGVRENRWAYDNFMEATGGPANRPPAEQHAEFVLGFEEFHNAAPDLIGAALENERGGVPNFSQQLTSRGILTAANLAGRGWTLLFWERESGARFLFADGRSEQIA